MTSSVILRLELGLGLGLDVPSELDQLLGRDRAVEVARLSVSVIRQQVVRKPSTYSDDDNDR